MTIIQPNKNNNKINFLISILMFMLIIFSVWAVFLYNQLVGFRHDIEKMEKITQQREVENAELKNNLYTLIDSRKTESLIDNGALVLEKNPQYVKSQELVASISN